MSNQARAKIICFLKFQIEFEYHTFFEFELEYQYLYTIDSVRLHL